MMRIQSFLLLPRQSWTLSMYFFSFFSSVNLRRRCYQWTSAMISCWIDHTHVSHRISLGTLPNLNQHDEAPERNVPAHNQPDEAKEHQKRRNGACAPLWETGDWETENIKSVSGSETWERENATENLKDVVSETRLGNSFKFVPFHERKTNERTSRTCITEESQRKHKKRVKSLKHEVKRTVPTWVNQETHIKYTNEKN